MSCASSLSGSDAPRNVYGGARPVRVKIEHRQFTRQLFLPESREPFSRFTCEKLLLPPNVIEIV